MLNAIATAITISTAPPTSRACGACRRSALTRRDSCPPARATASSGIAVPTANAAVTKTAVSPTRCVAPTTVMAASTGPAHGTYSTPSASPSTNPPPRPLGRRVLILANGRSSSAPSGGIR